MGTELLIKAPYARCDYLTRSLALVVRKSMACARCDFYTPTESTRSQLLEAKGNVQNMAVSIPLTDDEQAAVEDGQAALDRLLDRLTDTPTPAGPTPRELDLPATARLLPLVDVRKGRGRLRTALISECARAQESVTVTAVTLMNVLVDFARTGRIGPLHCGMPLTEAEDLLGPGRPHPAHVMKGSDIDGYPYSWNGLQLVVTQRAVSGIWINLWPGSTVKLPPLVLPDSESFEATVLREDLVTALNTAGCHHEVNPVLTFGEQSSILTQPAEVCAVFSLPGRDHHVPHRERHYLDVMHKHTA